MRAVGESAVVLRTTQVKAGCSASSGAAGGNYRRRHLARRTRARTNLNHARPARGAALQNIRRWARSERDTVEFCHELVTRARSRLETRKMRKRRAASPGAPGAPGKQRPGLVRGRGRPVLTENGWECGDRAAPFTPARPDARRADPRATNPGTSPGARGQCVEAVLRAGPPYRAGRASRVAGSLAPGRRCGAAMWVLSDERVLRERLRLEPAGG